MYLQTLAGVERIQIGPPRVDFHSQSRTSLIMDLSLVRTVGVKVTGLRISLHSEAVYLGRLCYECLPMLRKSSRSPTMIALPRFPDPFCRPALD